MEYIENFLLLYIYFISCLLTILYLYHSLHCRLRMCFYDNFHC